MYATKKGVFGYRLMTAKRNPAKFLVLMFGSFLLFQSYRWCFPQLEADVRTKYVGQTLEAQLNYPVEAAYQETKKVIEVLEMKEIVEIRLESLPRSRTLMVIRIGKVGDKDKANVILSQIVKNLNEQG